MLLVVSEVQNKALTMHIGCFLFDYGNWCTIVADHVKFGMVWEVKIMYENIFCVNPLIF
jgi:hypothetical protein